MKIETERLILRNYRKTDFEDYWEIVSQPNVGPRCGWEPYTNEGSALRRLYEESLKPFQFAIELKGQNKVVGSIEIMRARKELLPLLNVTAGEIRELGALLHEDYWGRGIMTEAMKAVVKYCFDDLGLKAVTAGYYKPNVGSGKIQMKCGLKPFHIEKNARVWYETGELVDAVFCRITRDEYEKSETYKDVKIKVTENKKDFGS